MNARDLIDKKSEILEPLHQVAREVVDVDRRGKGHLIEYTRLDVIAAAAVFIHVLSNKKAQMYLKRRDGLSVEQITKEMFQYGRTVNKLVFEMTGVNLDEKDKQ